ncbi:hypothetical protein PV08_06380 [Exophiala spinifera]|uniref:Uncharacterized protein n=1 Tax=Exophiala spinifera TaxID=91928 RepID=A0A0D2BYD3_9EURO|nr:uncharacterized protein PV08_06380 [Exophiala spinifera]KIW16329.1 hypothetical protein PV08_06380 [Exophiala spinifera]
MASSNNLPTTHANEVRQQSPLHWPIFDLMTPVHARYNPLPSTVIRSDGEYTSTGLENELNAMLESMALRPTHQHLQTWAAGLSQGWNAVSSSNDSGKTPMERFLGEGNSQGRDAFLEAPRAPGVHQGDGVKDKSPITKNHK